jgi:hypothetical protein
MLIDEHKSNLVPMPPIKSNQRREKYKQVPQTWEKIHGSYFVFLIRIRLHVQHN